MSMSKIFSNIMATDMTDMKKSTRDAVLFALGLFLTGFLPGIDTHSIFGNTMASFSNALWAGADAVYSGTFAYAMPFLMRILRSPPTA